MTKITLHHTNPLNEKLIVRSLGDANNAGAHTLFEILGFNTGTNPAWLDPAFDSLVIPFQNGNPNDPAVGANGITHEVLLAILIHRLTEFQAGPFAHERNAKAIEHLTNALDELQTRSAERIERGVEGQRVV
jgi:hypothetical protein